MRKALTKLLLGISLLYPNIVKSEVSLDVLVTKDTTGSNITATASSDLYSIFKEWYFLGTNNPLTVAISDPSTLTAIFEEKQLRKELLIDGLHNISSLLLTTH